MAISTEKVVDTYLNIVAGVPLNCNWPLYDEDEVVVIYGKASLIAELNVDYTVALSPPNYDQFTITPTATLIAKINALIGLDAEEINYATVRRELDYTTSTLPESVRQSTFVSREFERITMKLQQLSERLTRALKFPESEKGGDKISTMPKAADRARKALVFDEFGNLTVSTGDFDDIGTDVALAIAAAAAAAASAVDADNSADAAALLAAQFTGTSADAVLIGTGVKVFTTQVGKLFNGENVRVYSAANVNNYMDGIATYAGAALSVAVTSIGGAGTPNDWIIKVNGAKGETGAAGPAGGETGFASPVIEGFVVSSSQADLTNDISVTPGTCWDYTRTVKITLGATIIKRADAGWAAGTNQGGSDTGADLGTQGRIYIYAIKKDSDGTCDVLMSAAFNAPTMPLGYTYFRRIGVIKHASASAAPAMRAAAFGGGSTVHFYEAPGLDVNTTALGTAGAGYTLNLPNGGLGNIPLGAIVSAQISSATVGVTVTLYGGDNGQFLQKNSGYNAAVANGQPAGYVQVATRYHSMGPTLFYTKDTNNGNLAAIASAAATTLIATTLGYIDYRLD